MQLKRLLLPGMMLVVSTMFVIFLLTAALGIGLLLTDRNTTPTAEAGGMWFGWVYHAPTNSFLRVYEDGNTESHNLDLAAGDHMTSTPYAFAPNGEWLAFCINNEFSGMTSLVIHNFNPEAAAKSGQTFPVVITLGSNMECSVSGNAFNLFDSNQLAFGVHRYPSAEANADTAHPEWEMFVVDVTQGAIVAQYNADMPGASDLAFTDATRWAWMPYVHHFERDQVYFELVPWGTEAQVGQKVAAWTVGTQTVTLVDNSQAFVGVQRNMATNETVWLEEDPTLPAAQPAGPIPAYNVVKYRSPIMSDPVTIFHDATVVPLQLQWVNGGQMLAILTVPGFDPDNPGADPGASTWILLDRNGVVQTPDLGQWITSLSGLRDGFVVWRSNYETGTSELLRYQWTTDPATATVTQVFEGGDPNLSLVWSAPQFTGAEGQFPAVQ